ncbi:regulatory protein GntR, HTH [Saccharopolyspora erythraea NRRL 2338]|uniref:Regulatory protein GntR, HTH n=1 Tax=Saccharopolyspora erythraea (strain ATCC 11635 / DSM 40517 / JCM 4748 / NBRC 13426 / NCIMB 8594 / NRRL 2338) TaxID=405948 RepID=A4FM86_SACEN|nr:GntR family transcriptional regulator [Saccharopolyspora erythraea D]CAM05161.1 regulatory protein GntR, HTH [Saccharopolyspora erythraea NRRL 2338]
MFGRKDVYVPLVTTKRTGLVDQVIEQFRELMASGEWSLGSRIPPESELVTGLGVGRNTVREAIRALSHSGLLEVRQGDGTFVRATSEISGAVRKLCGSELRHVLEVRRALEVESARLAASARTEQDLRDLEVALHDRDEAVRRMDRETVITKDADFHLRLVQASHNPVLIGLYEGLSEAVRSSVASAFDPEIPPEEHVSHTELVAAVRDGDPDRAAAEAGGFLDELLAQMPSTDD